MIKDGIVENIAAWDGVAEWKPEGYELIDVTDIFVDIGYLYNNGAFERPPESEQE